MEQNILSELNGYNVLLTFFSGEMSITPSRKIGTRLTGSRFWSWRVGEWMSNVGRGYCEPNTH